MILHLDMIRYEYHTTQQVYLSIHPVQRTAWNNLCDKCQPLDRSPSLTQRGGALILLSLIILVTWSSFSTDVDLATVRANPRASGYGSRAETCHWNHNIPDRWPVLHSTMAKSPVENFSLG
jgi:hypothetical protein